MESLALGSEKMTKPAVLRDSRVCIVETRDDLIVYGNSPAFRSFAKWMEWIADSPPDEHYEVHLIWELLASFEQDSPQSVAVCSIRDESCDREGGMKFGYEGRELTFMHLAESELERLFSLSLAYGGSIPCIWANTMRVDIDALLAAATHSSTKPSR